MGDRWFQLRRGGWRPALVFGLLAVWCCGPDLGAQTDGSRRWAFSAGQRTSTESSPAVGPDGTIYVGVSINTTPPAGLLLAIDRGGGFKWSAPMPDAVDSSPALSRDGTTVYVGCWDGKLYAFDTANGAPRWNFSTGAFNYIVSSPAVGSDATIYVGAGDLRTEGAQDSGLYAIHPNGSFFWRKTTADPQFGPGETAVESSPAVGVDGTIYFGSFNRRVYAVDANGRERWSFAVDAPIWGSPAIGPDGTVYIGTIGGRLYALSRDGVGQWEYLTGGAIFGGPAIGADGTIYVGSLDSNLHALNPDKSVRWVTSVGQPILSTPAVRADGSIIFGADDRRVHAFTPAGTEQWSLLTSHFVRASPAVADGSIYVAALDGLIYAVNSPAAALSAFSSWPMFHGDSSHRGAVAPPQGEGRLINLSTRAALSSSTNLIAGFVVRGTTTKFYMVRAVGPALQQFGVSDFLGDPTLSLRRQQTGELIPGGFNDNWSDDTTPPISGAAEILGAFPLPVGSRDAVVLPLLQPAAYTATVGSADGGAGTALVEVYEAVIEEPRSALVNLSTRGHVAAGTTIIPGLSIGGNGPLRLLIRAVGPGLAQFGVPGVLPRPAMAVYSGQTVIRTNTGWTTEGTKGDLAGAARMVGAFPLQDNSADCAALLTLNPGPYTIQITGVDNSAGEVLVEIYAAP